MNNVSSQQGMTLLEVLVATAILAIISSMAFLSLDNLTTAKQTLDEKNKALNQENLAFYVFQNDLQLAVSSQQLNNNYAQGEFLANSQSITLLKYKSATAPVKRNNNLRSNTNPSSPLVRVRWSVRNDEWYRATLDANEPLNSNRWQERVMLEVSRFNCAYQNVNGQTQPIWPSIQREFSQVPNLVSCELETSNGLISQFKVVPWQTVGFL